MLDLHQQIPSGGQARDEVDAVNKPSQRCSPTANTDEPKPLDLLVQVSQCSTDIDLGSLYINCLMWFRLSVQGGGGGRRGGGAPSSSSTPRSHWGSRQAPPRAQDQCHERHVSTADLI
jgi:hypothetical protein